MTFKRYASQKERELLKKIEDKGGVAFRIAGSGSYGGKPDLVARLDGKYYVIEVKYTTTDRVYLREDQKQALIEQAEKFGAIPIIAVKFKGERRWHFYNARIVPNVIRKNSDIEEINIL